MLKTPTKDVKRAEKIVVREVDLFDDAPREESPDTVVGTEDEAEAVPEESELEVLRKQFVGDVNITEGCTASYHPRGASLIQGSS